MFFFASIFAFDTTLLKGQPILYFSCVAGVALANVIATTSRSATTSSLESSSVALVVIPAFVTSRDFFYESIEVGM